MAYLGLHKEYKEQISMSAPTWDCGWYWGFGYLGNHNCHYRLKNYANGRNIHMVDALKADYELTEDVLKDIWEFAELCLTAYTLIDYAATINRGGNNTTNNPCKELIKNNEEYLRINCEVLPAIFDQIDEIFEGVPTTKYTEQGKQIKEKLNGYLVNEP